MSETRSKIIQLTIDHWNKNFTGISGIDLSEELSIDHNVILNYLLDFERSGIGTLNKNVSLSLHTIKFEDSKITKSEPKDVITHIFSPSKEILQKHFNDNILKFKEFGVYTNMMQLGFSQIHQVFFEINVLSKYRNNKEQYDLDDDVTGGDLSLSSNYLDSLSEDEIDNIIFGRIQYGKRKLKNGTISISAILSDLAGLDLKEQAYWHSFEIEKPEFADFDNDYQTFLDRNFHALWVDTNDPIEELLLQLKQINQTLNVNLFNKIENPYLNYPLNNTFKDFVDCNSELYKLIGPDSLKLEQLQKLYIRITRDHQFNFKNKNSDRDLSPLQLLFLIIEHLDNQLSKDIRKVWDEVRNNRIEGDHKITTPTLSSENYIDKFRDVCTNVMSLLTRLNEVFFQFYNKAKLH